MNQPQDYNQAPQQLNHQSINKEYRMNKKISAKIGEYTNQSGEIKGRYANLGVILSNDKGEFMLLDPTVNLAGVLQLQNQLDLKQGKDQSDRIMCGIFQEQQQGQQQQGQQQQAPQMQQPQYQQPSPQMQQQGYNNNGSVNF